MSRFVGVDLAATPQKTGVCVLEGSTVVSILRGSTSEGTHPDWITPYCAGADVVAVDVPFGWPKPFTEALAGYLVGDRMGLDKNRYRLRKTDFWIKENFPPLNPISVSTDKIGVTAIVGTLLLNALSSDFALSPTESQADRSVIEVYPAVSLLAWGLPFRGYKNGEEASRMRRAILRKLQHEFGLDLAERQSEVLAASEHCLDALIAALTAQEYARGAVFAPEDPQDDTLKTEGWIWAPDRLSAHSTATPSNH
jgi:predicted nuclease with RNAse H fold